MVIYVESTEGFKRAEEILKHVYVKGEHPHSFRFSLPGETLTRALLRRNLGMYLGQSPRVIARQILDEFTRSLESRLKTDPYRIPIEVAEAGPIPQTA